MPFEKNDGTGGHAAEFLRLRKECMETEFARMNPMQRKAVFHTEGPLLILAGAGSGKTTVLVNRIACILKYGCAYASDAAPGEITEDDLTFVRGCLEKKEFGGERLAKLLAVRPAPPWTIMAITFTNKAANELKERLAALLGPTAEDIWACTFHSACSRILRRDIDKLGMGYSRSFTIYDTEDSVRVMRQFCKNQADDRSFASKVALPAVSRAKEKGLGPEAYARLVAADSRLKPVAEAYAQYQEALRQANALDFDDMILLTVRLLERCEDVRTYYRKRFRYILVDEYQDTNLIQYKLVSLLTSEAQNLCVVGDDDQSIYGFRGATIENIMSFEKQFQNAAVIRLEQNYRSTSNILNAANGVIGHNVGRKGKTLWTRNGAGNKVEIHAFENEGEEAQYIAESILAGVRGGRKFSEHAVLYRMNAQSGAVEKALVRSGIPYRIIGGFRFYDRLEIKDIMAYLCVLNNKNDNLHFERIVNVPKRGIGNATLEAARETAQVKGLSLYDAFRKGGFSSKNPRIGAFLDLMDELREQAQQTLPHELVEQVIRRSGYLEALESSREPDAEDRIQNLNTLISNAADYEAQQDEATLEGFLEEAALMTDLDNYDADADTAVLMTVHSAKGLEFPSVFIAGMEDGIFPNQMSILYPEELEEERRLAYVAITRAKEQLSISYARMRMIFGKTVYHAPSRFLAEIPEECRQEPEKPKKRITAKEFQRKPKPTPVGGIGTMPSAVHSAAVPQHFAAGETVVHGTFGEGMVLSAKPMGNDMLLEIAFERFGTKKVMANFAKLKKK